MFDPESALQLARRHVVDGSRFVAEQSARLSRLDPHGGQLRIANELLETMESTLAIFIDDLARLEAMYSYPSPRAEHTVSDCDPLALSTRNGQPLTVSKPTRTEPQHGENGQAKRGLLHPGSFSAAPN
jgi:hypothetical protein